MNAWRRQAELDWLRGLMLVLMTFTHLPTWFSAEMGQPFGFVSAAEGFVFLSAFLVGTVYSRMEREQGHEAMRRRLHWRAGKLYAAHVGVLLFLLWVMLPVATALDAHPLTDLASYYTAHPRRALAGGMLLVYQPPLLDILPMYVLFMLASPWVLAYGARRTWTPLVAVSIALWALAQFDFGHLLYGVLGADLPLPPYNQTGAFGLMAWQLMWMAGLWAGARSLDGPPLRLPPGAVPCAAVVAIAFFAWRHTAGQMPVGPGVVAVMLDKWHLGALRLLDFAALVVLALAARRQIERWAERSVLVTFGRAALPVFCAHLVICLIALTLVPEPSSAQLHWRDTALLAGALTTLYLVALLSLEGARVIPRLVASFNARLAAARTAR